MVDELLKNKYNNIHFYCHNLHGYDIVYLLKTIEKFNEYLHTCVIPPKPINPYGNNNNEANKKHV